MRETLVGLRPPDVPRMRRQVAYFCAAKWTTFAPPLTNAKDRIVSRSRMRAIATRAVALLGVNLDLDAEVGALPSVAQAQWNVTSPPPLSISRYHTT